MVDVDKHKKVIKHTVTVITSAGGAFSQTIAVFGTIEKVWLDLGTLSTPDIDITDATTGETILSYDGAASDTLDYPMRVADGTDGATLTVDKIYTKISADRITVAVSGGGDTLSGIIYIWVSK
jgi:hypothetical protein